MTGRPELTALLEQERADTRTQIAALDADFATIVEASAQVATDDEHDPEGATIAFERQQVDAIRTQALRRLDDLDRAIEQLAAGTYGDCETCGRPIAAERLAARPAARTCIGCASLADVPDAPHRGWLLLAGGVVAGGVVWRTGGVVWRVAGGRRRSRRPRRRRNRGGGRGDRESCSPWPSSSSVWARLGRLEALVVVVLGVVIGGAGRARRRRSRRVLGGDDGEGGHRGRRRRGATRRRRADGTRHLELHVHRRAVPPHLGRRVLDGRVTDHETCCCWPGLSTKVPAVLSAVGKNVLPVLSSTIVVAGSTWIGCLLMLP